MTKQSNFPLGKEEFKLILSVNKFWDAELSEAQVASVMTSPLSALIVNGGECKLCVPHRETAVAWRMPCPNRLTGEDMRSEPICIEKQDEKENEHD